MKRQQAAEDRIALHLAAAAGALPTHGVSGSCSSSGALPPGRIYGMTVTPPTDGNLTSSGVNYYLLVTLYCNLKLINFDFTG